MDKTIEQMHIIPVGQDFMELTARGTPDFPVAMYDNTFSEFITGCVPWHWHSEVEFIYLLTGEISLRCGEQTERIEAGTGAFISANTLHSMLCVDPKLPCRMLSIAFSPSLIAGLPHGLCEQKYVAPLGDCKNLPYMKFRPDEPGQAEILAAFHTAFQAYERHGFACELVVIEQLTGIWRRIVTQNRPLLQIPNQRAGDERIKQMLVFIQNNYASRLTLKDIAASVHISERACTRSFREKLHTTPFAYLNTLRVRVAAEKLRNSQLTIGEIAEAVGFDGDSYFSKVFRNALGCSPREYRSRTAGDTH